MKRELPCRGPALTAARDVMQKLRVDARRVQVDAIDLQWKNWDGELSLCALYTDQSFLVWLDSSFLRLGPLIFPADARRVGQDWPPVRRPPAGLGLD
jgi:hypothetical protein